MIYIIVLTWNGLKYIKSLISSLNSLSIAKENMRLVVVDSYSTDGTREYLTGLNQANLKLIRLDKNYGFAGGNNAGLKLAIKGGADYVFILNQDTIVEPDSLVEMIKACESDSQIGIVQPLICYYQNKNEINSWGNELHYLGYGFSGGNHEQKSELKKQKTEISEITYASAAAVLYKVAMLKKIGLFDENYFAYHEDTDLSLRAKLAGYKIVLAAQAVVYHDYQFPTNKNKERYYWLEKNRLYLVLKFYSFKTLLILSPMFCLMAIGQLFYALKNGYLLSFLKTRWWCLVNLKKILSERQAIKSMRLLDDRQLMNNFASEIKFQEVNNSLLIKVANPIMKFYWSVVKKMI